MDRLPPETQEQLKKMSTARLTAKLGRAGYDVDRLEELDRGELLEALAEVMPVRRTLCLPLGYIICCLITSKAVWLRIMKL